MAASEKEQGGCCTFLSGVLTTAGSGQAAVEGGQWRKESERVVGGAG